LTLKQRSTAPLRVSDELFAENLVRAFRLVSGYDALLEGTAPEQPSRGDKAKRRKAPGRSR
jgi:hypothetical protein